MPISGKRLQTHAVKYAVNIHIQFAKQQSAKCAYCIAM